MLRSTVSQLSRFGNVNVRRNVAVVPKRFVTALAMRGGAGVIGAVSAYVLFQVLQRIDWNQRRRIRHTLLLPQAELAAFRPGPLFLARPEKHAFVTELFNSDPGGPIVVTGPQGSGKTMVLKRALAGRAEALYLDLRATPATSGDALSVAFVAQAGYLLPPNELLGRAIFTREAVSGATLSLELDRAFRLITEELRASKARGWVVTSPSGARRIVPPLLCIDELNAGGDGAALMEDPAFWRFIDWVLFLTDNRLAHVTLATSLDVAATLDAYPGWRVRRQRVHIDYPRPATVANYLTHTMNPFLVRVLKAEERENNTLKSVMASSTSPRGVEAQTLSTLTSSSVSPSSLPITTTTSTAATTTTLEAEKRSLFEASSPTPLSTTFFDPAPAPPKEVSWINRFLWGQAVTSTTVKPPHIGEVGDKKLTPLSPASASALSTENSAKNITTTTSTTTKSIHSLHTLNTNTVLPTFSPTSAAAAVVPNERVSISSSSSISSSREDIAASDSRASSKNHADALSTTTSTAIPTITTATATTTTMTDAVINANNIDHYAGTVTQQHTHAVMTNVAATTALPNTTVAAAIPLTPTAVVPVIDSESDADTFVEFEGPSSLVATARGKAKAQVMAAAAAAAAAQAAAAAAASVADVPISSMLAAADSSTLSNAAVETTTTLLVPPSLTSPPLLSKSLSPSTVKPFPLSPIITTATTTSTTATPKKILPIPTSSTSATSTTTTPSIPPSFKASLPSSSRTRESVSSSNGGGGGGGGEIFTLAPWEVAAIVETVGGHLKDLDSVVTAITRGKHWASSLERLVADSAEHVERVLESLLSSCEGGSGDGSIGRDGGGTVNLGLTATGQGPPGGGPSGGVRTSMRPTTRARLLPLSAPPSARAGTPHPRPAWDYSHLPRPDRLAAYARYLRAWALLESLALKTYAPRRELALRIFAGCPHELDLFAEAGLIATISVRGTAMGVGVSEPLDFSLPGSLVGAASPRLRAAFRAIVEDPRMRAQTERVRSALRLARAREDEVLLTRRHAEAIIERSYWSSAVGALMMRDTALRSAVAKELVMMQASAPVTGSDFLNSGSTIPASSSSSGESGESATKVLVEGDHSGGAPVSPTPPPPMSTLLGAFGLTASFDAALISLRAAEVNVSLLREQLVAVRAAILAGEEAADKQLYQEEESGESEAAGAEKLVKSASLRLALLKFQKYSKNHSSYDENNNGGGNSAEQQQSLQSSSSATTSSSAGSEDGNGGGGGGGNATSVTSTMLPMTSTTLSYQPLPPLTPSTSAAQFTTAGNRSSTSGIDSSRSSVLSPSSPFAYGTSITPDDSVRPYHRHDDESSDESDSNLDSSSESDDDDDEDDEDSRYSGTSISARRRAFMFQSMNSNQKTTALSSPTHNNSTNGVPVVPVPTSMKPLAAGAFSTSFWLPSFAVAARGARVQHQQHQQQQQQQQQMPQQMPQDFVGGGGKMKGSKRKKTRRDQADFRKWL